MDNELKEYLLKKFKKYLNEKRDKEEYDFLSIVPNEILKDHKDITWKEDMDLFGFSILNFFEETGAVVYHQYDSQYNYIGDKIVKFDEFNIQDQFYLWEKVIDQAPKIGPYDFQMFMEKEENRTREIKSILLRFRADLILGKTYFITPQYKYVIKINKTIIGIEIKWGGEVNLYYLAGRYMKANNLWKLFDVLPKRLLEALEHIHRYGDPFSIEYRVGSSGCTDYWLYSHPYPEFPEFRLYKNTVHITMSSVLPNEWHGTITSFMTLSAIILRDYEQEPQTKGRIIHLKEFSVSTGQELGVIKMIEEIKGQKIKNIEEN